MSASFDLEADRLTAGAIGEPGERTFFVQAAGGGAMVTLLAEKEQVRMLAQAAEHLLSQLPEIEEDVPPPETDLELAQPLVPEWQVGEMSIEYDEAADRVALVFDELPPDEEEEAEDPLAAIDLGRARFVATRAQVRAMADRALAVVAAGRPRCQLCGLPMEPGGDHVCPATNGHRAPRA